MKDIRFGMGYCSELLKQMNVKQGGDIYQVAMPVLPKKHVMLIGIDVCHDGPRSILGFCATLNSAFSQYFSMSYYQEKGKEIGNENLGKCFAEALEAYCTENGQYPNHIIVYRDGVGDSMRKQVKLVELKMLFSEMKKKSTMHVYNVTLIIVNKRINQRFFSGVIGNAQNPPSGTLIDTELVQIEDETSKAYDFFLISQEPTQGCSLPTHFFCAYDDSECPRTTMEQLTFNLCFFYYNWGGSIKVPAPCQYAHTVAKFSNDAGSCFSKDNGFYFI